MIDLELNAGDEIIFTDNNYNEIGIAIMAIRGKEYIVNHSEKGVSIIMSEKRLERLLKSAISIKINRYPYL